MIPILSSDHVNEADVKAAQLQNKRHLQTELTLLEGDRNKQSRLRDVFAADIKKIELEIRRAEVELVEKKESLNKVERDISNFEAEIKRAKRLLNALS